MTATSKENSHSKTHFVTTSCRSDTSFCEVDANTSNRSQSELYQKKRGQDRIACGSLIFQAIVPDYIMPRFLSRNVSKLKRNEPFAMRQDTFHSPSCSLYLQDGESSLLHRISGEINKLCSPSLTRLSTPSLLGENHRISQGPKESTMDDSTEGVWGLFVDPWEVENEMIRTSHILSQKYFRLQTHTSLATVVECTESASSSCCNDHD